MHEMVGTLNWELATVRQYVIDGHWLTQVWLGHERANRFYFPQPRPAQIGDLGSAMAAGAMRLRRHLPQPRRPVDSHADAPVSGNFWLDSCVDSRYMCLIFCITAVLHTNLLRS